MVQGQIFLKGGRWGVGTFPIYFFQGLSSLHLEIFLSFANCVMHLKKSYFFLSPKF